MSNLRQIAPELTKLAEAELGEKPERITGDIEHVKEWMGKQPHLIGRPDDELILAFLRGCKYSLERVKEKIDMYYTVRTTVPDFFANRDPSDPHLQFVMSKGITLPLPFTEHPESPRILLFRIGEFDTSRITVSELMKVCYMITDILLWEDPNTSISGHTILVDLRKFSFSHIALFPANLIKKMTTSIQEAYPIRTKAIHFVNPPTSFETLFKIFASFMTDKLRKRLYVHESFDALHKVIPKRLLPTEYGGEAGDAQHIANYWKETLVKRRDWFIEEENYKTDERKRIGKSKVDTSIYGTDGSFRSLAVD